MNKTDLIDRMAEHAGITKAASKKALECALIEIEGALQLEMEETLKLEKLSR